jgi:hypothetical protein
MAVPDNSALAELPRESYELSLDENHKLFIILLNRYEKTFQNSI